MNSQSSGSSAYVDQSELEIGLAALEHGAAACTFISGQTAVGAVLDLLDKGTHVILAPEMRGARSYLGRSANFLSTNLDSNG